MTANLPEESQAVADGGPTSFQDRLCEKRPRIDRLHDPTQGRKEDVDLTIDGDDQPHWRGMESGLRRILRWRIPPNWSYADWREEARATAIAAAWQASRDFDPSRSVPREAFLHRRVIATVYTRYRQEWSYATHNAPANSELLPDPDSNRGRSSATSRERLREAMRYLSDSEQQLLTQLFWEGRTQGEAAAELNVSQQAVSRRVRVCLRKLAGILEVVAYVDGFAP